MEDSFGHWLAGFIDGEGCFTIIQHANGSWEVKFYLSLRDDDMSVLEEIQDRLGIGRIYRTPERGSTRPQASWRVTRLSDSLKLIEFLDRLPLRARKAKDYAIWREAIFAKSKKTYGDDAGLPYLSTALKSGRAYKPQTSRG
jgi:hypothetical protein